MMKCLFLFAASALVLLSLAGCAYSSGSISPAHPVMTGEPGSMDFVLVSTTSDVADSEAERQAFNDRVYSDLRESELFPNISEEATNNVGPGTGVQVDSKIIEIKRVSRDARVWFGGLAGRARIVVRVRIVDLASGKQIEAFEAAGISGDYSWSGTTDEAIQRAAGQVAAEVVRLNSRTARMY